ncbi:MAG TPA: Stk1 family PASTA domain-containing Ser/Thr kinase [Propionibacteriaceae bacterium]|nr:Stk1 family PASTA domain-containing Ser/Thr kinase [Propionibacteriaceae bacterium]
MTSIGDPLVGRVLDGRYEILSRLARGGMATVYRAQDRRLTRTVAVKVMHDGLGDDAEFARKFDREARAAAMLSNPHIVSVFDQGRDNGRPYIVMEYVEGSTLRHVITREAPLDPLRALDLLEPVVHALATAHEGGIVHRDIKPENVLISDRGQIKVADFGLARAMTSQTATATAGLLMGTVSYLPPELVTTGRTDARGDIYSTGVVLFEMLTGRKPHTGDVPIQVAYSHVHNDVPAPSSQLPAHEARRIPAYLDALVLACTRRRPTERPDDARHLLRLIRRARRAIDAGVTDDPALTRDMWSSVSGSRIPPHSPDSPTEPLSERSPDLPRPAPALRPSATPPAMPVREVARVATPRTPRSPISPVTGPILSPVERGVRYSRVVARRRRRRTTLLLLTVVVLAGLVAGWRVWQSARQVAEPVLTGMTQQDAESTLTANHLAGTFHDEYSETVGKGLVIRTQPGAGAPLDKGTTVAAWVSLGPERHPMPRVVGLSESAARQAITGASLSVGKVTSDYSDTVASGNVISASKPEGASLKRDTPVDLVVSKGRRPIAIPSVVGQSVDDARGALSKLGFKVSVTSDHSKTVPSGQVISQNPSNGTGFKGDTVTLVKSLGPVMVTVPDVRLKSEAEARSILQGAGFSVVVQYPTPSWLRVDLVSGEVPGGGQRPEGSTITIYVS